MMHGLHAAFEGPSMANIAAVRMAGHLWLPWIRVKGQSWKPLTHWTYVDPPSHAANVKKKKGKEEHESNMTTARVPLRKGFSPMVSGKWFSNEDFHV